MRLKLGLPLDQLLAMHVGDNVNLRRLVKNSFIEVYDNNLAITATLYAGIERVLKNLVNQNNIISLVTNKRKNSHL